jgi:hypothetical protein
LIHDLLPGLPDKTTRAAGGYSVSRRGKSFKADSRMDSLCPYQKPHPSNSLIASKNSLFSGVGNSSETY